MFKSLFSKYFTIFSLIPILAVLVLGSSQLLFSYRYWTEEKKAALADSATQVAEFAAGSATQESDGYYYLSRSTGYYLNAMTSMTDFNALIVSKDGSVIVSAADGAVHEETVTLPAPLMTKLHTLEQSGDTVNFTPSVMRPVYADSRYTVACPIVKDEVIGYALVSSSASALSDYVNNNIKIFLLSALLVLLLTFLVSYLAADRLVRPLRRMAAAVRSFSTGDFSARIPVRGNDEVAQLASSLNAMAAALSSEEEMRRSFIANVSHELKTPMTTIAGFIDGILDGTIPDSQRDRYLRIVSDEVKRLSRLVRSMLNLSRIDAGQLKLNPVSFDLTETVGSVLISFEQRINEKHIAIEGLEDCPRMPVCGDFDLLGQVVYNLLDNAIKFTNDGGTIRITMRHADGRIYCAIRNTGMGIAACELPRIFERFYKTDKSRGLDKNGVGLGLYIVQNVIQLHHGEITVRSVEGESCEFEFWLPEDPAAAYVEDGFSANV